MENIKDRKYGIDLVRILAVVLVITYHFFLNTHYCSLDYTNANIQIQNFVRNFANSCVPLFILITGFLNIKTKYDKKFFKSLIEIIIIWLLYSIIEYIVINVIYHTMDNLNLRNFIYEITSFQANRYSWYIEMFIGLYLITPLLNVGYNNLEKKDKNIFVLIIISLTTLFPFLNLLLEKSLHFPSYWGFLYIIGYYYIGKWISTNEIKVKKKTLLILLLLNQIFIFSYSKIILVDFDTLPTIINATLLFLLLYDVDLKNKKIKKVVVYLSSIVLDINLASSIIDHLIYNHILGLSKFNHNQELLFIYSPIIIFTVLILCIIYASIRKMIIKVR